MSNWTALTATLVKTGKRSEIYATVESVATTNGDADPVPEMIADVTATIRAALSMGSVLDIDQTKIPNSLKGLALRMMTRRLKDYIEYPLSTDELKQADDDRNYLNQIINAKIQFEKPDTPSGSAEQQPASGFEQTTGGNLSGDPTQIAPRDTLKGL